MPVTRIFARGAGDMNALYSTWHSEGGCIVSLVVEGMGEIRMTPAKAEEISDTLKRQAEYAREARSRTSPVPQYEETKFNQP